MAIAIRRYRGGDEAGMLALWNRVLVHDPLDAPTFYRKIILDPNFDPGGTLIAVEGDHVVGFIQAMVRKVPLGTDYDPEMGWITTLAVAPEHRRRGLGGQLLEGAEAYLVGLGRKRVEFSSYAPNYVVPGVDEAGYPGATSFFLSQGFQELYPCVAMDRTLVDYVVPDEVEALLGRLNGERILVESVSPPFYTRLLEFCDREFYADWTRALRDALAAGVAADQLKICHDGASILGFALFGAYDRNFDRFGPFGVAAGQRGKGLGKALLHVTLDEMKRQGAHDAWFLWTGETSPAGQLYRSAGFTVTRRFTILQKALR